MTPTQGFSLDQFLSNNQPKIFEEKVELSNPIVETGRHEEKKMDLSLDEKQADVLSSESDRVSRVSRTFNWDSV